MKWLKQHARPHWLESARFNLPCRQALYEGLGYLVASDVAPLAALQAMRDEYDAADARGARYQLICLLCDDMDKGHSLSTSLADWIPASELMIIESYGSSNQRMAQGLAAAGEHTRRMQAIKGRMAAEAIKPSLALLFSCLLLVGGYHQLSVYTSMIPVHEWPGLAQRFHAMAGLLADNLGWVLICLPVLLWLGRWLIVTVPQQGPLARAYDRYRPQADRFSLFAMYRTYSAYSFLTSFAVLTRNGLGPQAALERLYDQASDYLRQHIDRMLPGVQAGQNAGEALTGTQLFDLEQALRIRIVARTGGFAAAIERIAEEAFTVTEKQIVRLMRTYTVAATLTFGVVFVWAALSQLSITSTML